MNIFLQFFSKLMTFGRKNRLHAEITKLYEQGDVISLLDLLNHQDEEIRFKARIAIVEMGSQAFLILESCLSDRDPKRRYNAIIAIGDMLNHHELYAEKAIPKLKQLAKSDENPAVAKIAGKVLEMAFIITKNKQLLV